jgi:hypothetical protein
MSRKFEIYNLLKTHLILRRQLAYLDFDILRNVPLRGSFMTTCISLAEELVSAVILLLHVYFVPLNYFEFSSRKGKRGT